MINGRLLVVDDEPALRSLLERYLIRIGFDVDAAGSGAEAWELFEPNAGSYRLLVLDLSLPDISGEQLLSKMRSLRPDLPAILCSGSLPSADAKLSETTLFLQKPFLPQMLKETVEKALAAKSG